jgi:hypothetical protein
MEGKREIPMPVHFVSSPPILAFQRERFVYGRKNGLALAAQAQMNVQITHIERRSDPEGRNRSAF